MTLIIADPALTAAPAPLAGSAARTRDLRAELADAIQNRRAPEAIAADAKRLSDRRERAKADANMVVNQLKTRRPKRTPKPSQRLALGSHQPSRANDRQRLPISGNS